MARRGYEPIVYDNLVYGHEYAVHWGDFVKGDISDRSRLESVFALYQPCAVMHFAAYAYVGESVTDPAKYYGNNVVGTISLLDAMRSSGVDKIIFSSTCATYGDPVTIPMDEMHPQSPINPYGQSKLMIEKILNDYSVAYGLRSVALRYFNAAGADPDCEVGEDHDPETHLIPLVLDAALAKRESITVFGEDYDTPDGSCIRDYVHVTDLAAAHVLALEALISGAETTAYNLGNGAGFSVKEVIDVARKVTRENIPVVLGERRSGDPARLIGNASKVIAELGWKPEYSDIDTIIRTAWQWHQREL